MKYIIFIAAMCVVTGGWAQPCEYDSPAWQGYGGDRQKKLLQNPPYKEMDDACFSAYLDRLAAYTKKKGAGKKLFIALKAYCTAQAAFSRNALGAFVRSAGHGEAAAFSKDVETLWKLYNGQVERLAASLEKQGQYAEADSLFTDFDVLGLLDVYHLIKWANIKGVLSKYTAAAELFCRISAHSTSFIAMAQSQFYRLLVEADSPDIQSSALQAYRECYLSQVNADTLMLSKWLSRTAHRLDLYDFEVDAILQLDGNAQTRGDRLLSVAQRQFRRSNYAKAIRPARLAWQDITFDHRKQECAIILYQSYSNTGKNDSAIVWLERVNLKDLKSKARAVTLYQRSGLFTKADSIINTILTSVCKDTLITRQFLFRGDVEKAASYMSKQPKTSRYWVAVLAENLFWKLRTAVFAGNLFGAGTYLDSLNSVHYRPVWPYAGEVLSCKMALQRLGAYPEAFKYWGQLQYTIYLGKPEVSVKNAKTDSWPDDVGEYLSAALVNALIEKENYDTAQAVLGRIARKSETPQIYFLRGYVHFMQGDSEKAKKLFENIILMYPDDVFAHKARIYLLKLKKS